MLLLANELEARGLVDLARRDEHVVRPQRELAVPLRAREANAFVDELAAYAQATRRRLDIQQTQLRNLVARAHQEDAADDLAVALRNPRVLARRIEVHDEAAQDLRDERLIGLIPAVFLGVEHRLA